MGRQASIRRERRLNPKKVTRPISRAEIARAVEKAENERMTAAIARHMPEGVMERVAAVTKIMRSPEFEKARSTAMRQADLRPNPPRNEEDVRSLLLEVLRGEPFNADTRDVLLKIFVNQKSKTLTVDAGPGVEASGIAVAGARAELAQAAAAA